MNTIAICETSAVMDWSALFVFKIHFKYFKRCNSFKHRAFELKMPCFVIAHSGLSILAFQWG